MIVDSSALLAIVLGESDAERFLDVMAAADSLAISASIVVEATIAAESRGGPEAADDVQGLLAELEVEVIQFDEEQARAAVTAWRRFGKGRHQASLNLGDTYSYALASVRGEPLLFKGNNFTATDVGAVLQRSLVFHSLAVGQGSETASADRVADEERGGVPPVLIE